MFAGSTGTEYENKIDFLSSRMSELTVLMKDIYRLHTVN